MKRSGSYWIPSDLVSQAIPASSDFPRIPSPSHCPCPWPSPLSLQTVKWSPGTARDRKGLSHTAPLPPRAALPQQTRPPLPGAPPPWVTDCDQVLLPVSGNSFPVSPQFHLSGAPRPSPIPRHCAPSRLPGSWLLPLFLCQHSLKISAASVLSAETRQLHSSDILVSLGSTRTLLG